MLKIEAIAQLSQAQGGVDFIIQGKSKYILLEGAVVNSRSKKVMEMVDLTEDGWEVGVDPKWYDLVWEDGDKAILCRNEDTNAFVIVFGISEDGSFYDQNGEAFDTTNIAPATLDEAKSLLVKSTSPAPKKTKKKETTVEDPAEVKKESSEPKEEKTETVEEVASESKEEKTETKKSEPVAEVKTEEVTKEEPTTEIKEAVEVEEVASKKEKVAPAPKEEEYVAIPNTEEDVVPDSAVESEIDAAINAGEAPEMEDFFAEEEVKETAPEGGQIESEKSTVTPKEETGDAADTPCAKKRAIDCGLKAEDWDKFWSWLEKLESSLTSESYCEEMESQIKTDVEEFYDN